MTGTQSIGSLMAAVMADVEAVGKNRKNEAQRYNFRGIDDFANALHPLLAKHGIHLLPEVLEHHDLEAQETKSGGLMFRVKLRMALHFVAPDDSRRTATVWAEGADTGDKATNKATSAALKYALIATFLVPTEELVDSETDSHEARRAPAKPAAASKPKPPAPASPSPALLAARKALAEARSHAPADWRAEIDKDERAAGDDASKVLAVATKVKEALTKIDAGAA